MKQIKFRAWWYVGLMYYVDKLEFYRDKLEMVYLSEDGKQGADTWAKATDPGLHLMQFTGLHDTADTEIYEGDILTTKTGTGAVGAVLFDHGMYFSKHPKTGLICHIYQNPCEYRVIGNIHENPELLK